MSYGLRFGAHDRPERKSTHLRILETSKGAHLPAVPFMLRIVAHERSGGGKGQGLSVKLHSRGGGSEDSRLVRHNRSVSLRHSLDWAEAEDSVMARIEGIDPKQTSFLMRQVFSRVRKTLGRDLTPQKIAARVPRVFWTTALAEWLLGQKAAVPQRQRMLLTLRTAVRVGCPF